MFSNFMVLVNEVICYISIYTFKICGGSVFIYHTWDFHCIFSIRKLKSHYGKSSTNMALEPDSPINLCSNPHPQPWTHCHLFCKMRISTCGAVNKTYNVYKSYLVTPVTETEWGQSHLETECVTEIDFV